MKKALLVGINYIGTNAQLAGCINDVYHMQDVLKQVYGFEDITILEDGEMATELPTKDTIVYHMRSLVENVSPGDVLVFHYSGHGSSMRDVNNDEKDRMDEMLCPLDYQLNGFITDDAIYSTLIQQVPPGVKLICFIDACHSGTMCDLKYNFKYVSPPIATANFEEWGNNFKLWQENKNVTLGTVMMFSGCQDEQTSADAYISSQSQGAFTWAFLSVLTEYGYKIKNNNLLKYVNALLMQNGYDQHAQFSTSSLSAFEEAFSL